MVDRGGSDRGRSRSHRGPTPDGVEDPAWRSGHEETAVVRPTGHEGLAARRAEQQRVIASLAGSALAQLDLDVLFDKCVEQVAEHLGAPLCKVLELTAGGSALFLRSGVGWTPGLVGSASVPTDAGSQGGYTLLQDHPVVVRDLRDERRFQGPQLLDDHDVVSGISTVIRATNGRAWGVLGVHTTQEAAFDGDDIAFIDAVAGIIGGAIARRAVEDELAATVERLEVSERVRGAFVNAVSHELRTPLQAIVGFAETLADRDGQLTDDVRTEALDRLVANTHRLRAQIERILEVGDLDRGLVTAKREPVALHVLLERLLQRRRDEPATVVADLAPVTAALDEAKVERAIGALIDNALRAAGPDGLVTVRLGRDGGTVRVEVEDDGPGLDPATRESLFEPFVQGRERAAAPQPGIGVGLTLARGFVELHDGEIEVTTGPGAGTCIAVRFPSDPPG